MFDAVFSNLEKVAPNHFSGHTSSVTLMSGFLDYLVVEGTTIVYPYLNHVEFNEMLITEYIQDFIRDFSDRDSIETIFVMPNLNLRDARFVIHGDHMTVGWLVEMTEMAYLSLINPRKLTLYGLLDTYVNDQAMFFQEVSWELSMDIYNHNRYAVMIHERIESLGEEVFLELASAYIEDDADERSISEFLLDLEE